MEPHRSRTTLPLSSLLGLALNAFLPGCEDNPSSRRRTPESPPRAAPPYGGARSRSSQSGPAGFSPGARGLALAEMYTPYPPGSWRKLPPATLESVRLWVSHVLIRHREVTRGGVVFGPLDVVAPPQVSRSRHQALALAQRLQEQARAAPERFATLARHRSEDEVTRTTGGSLGAVHGLSLLAFPQVLDAFATLQPGEVSEVVETDYGFHVFELRAPPPARTFNASHIVIGYDDAPWLQQHLARGTVPRRSRSEAIELATHLYERARAAPTEFAALASRYSEHFDAARGGDLGAWSTRRPGGYGRELELLAELPVGGVAPPIDTLFGVEVLQRTADRPREVFAAEPIRLPFDPDPAASGPFSKPAVLALATALTRSLSAAPQRFAELQARHCCAGEVLRWSESQEPTALATTIERLAVGQIAPEPIAFASSYVIPRRVDPEPTLPRNALRFAVPGTLSVDEQEVRAASATAATRD